MGNQQSSGAVVMSAGSLLLSSPQPNIPDTTPTLVLLDSINAGYVEGIESVATHLITISKAGIYQVTGQICWENIIAGASYWALLLFNSAYYIGVAAGSPANAQIATPLVTAPLKFAAGETVGLWGYQNSGGATPDIVATNGLGLGILMTTHLDVHQIK